MKKEDLERKWKTEVSELKDTKKKDTERIQKDAELIAELRKQPADKNNEGEDVQNIAWRKYMKEESVKTLQKEKHYSFTKVDGVDTHPHANRISRELGEWHTDPTTLNLEWSPSGGWHRVPITKNQQGGPEYHSYNVGRIENYEDTSGVKRRTMAYGVNSDQLLVWYDVEDMLRTMEWVIPDTSPWVNSRKWKNEFRISPSPKKKSQEVQQEEALKEAMHPEEMPREGEYTLRPREVEGEARVTKRIEEMIVAATTEGDTSSKTQTGVDMKAMIGKENPQELVGPLDQLATQE